MNEGWKVLTETIVLATDILGRKLDYHGISRILIRVVEFFPEMQLWPTLDNHRIILESRSEFQSEYPFESNYLVAR